MKIHAEIEPVYIIGDFSLQSAPKGWVVKANRKKLKLGSWKDQGLPFYSWGVLYKKTFDVPKKTGNYQIGLSEWKGTAAEIIVNGKSTGTIALHSDEVDVTDYIEMGKNNIEVKIIGSLKNLLGPHHNNPKPGIASPWHWRGTKKYPAGKDYQMLDYGLMGDIYFYEG